MAEGKKAFIFYTNWKNYTDVMTNEQAGIWVKWCLDYCNDLDPDYPEDTTAKMLCVMCKDILKADLKKYEEKKERFKKIAKQYNYDTEIDTEIEAENGNRKREPKSDSVISNKLIVNSNKCISNDILYNTREEEESIDKLQDLIQAIEDMLSRCLTNAEAITIKEFSKTMSNESIIRDLTLYSDKQNPIAYMKKMIENAKIQEQVKPYNNEGTPQQPQTSGSAWLDNWKKAMNGDKEAEEYLKKH